MNGWFETHPSPAKATHRMVVTTSRGQSLANKSSMGSLKVQMKSSPDNKRPPSWKTSAGTHEDVPEINPMTCDDTPESARRMVDLNQNNLIQINVVHAQNKNLFLPAPLPEAIKKYNDQNTLDLPFEPDARKTTRRLSLQPTKLS